MRINGRKLSLPNEEILVLPRGEDEPIVLRARAVLDMSQFHELCPTPEPPSGIKRGGERFKDTDDPRYIRQNQEHNQKYFAYMIIKSLEATENLEWETVNINDSSTWLNYESELQTSGFSEIEVAKVKRLVMDANSLNDEKLDEAKKNFLRSQEVNHVLS
jgi:hypothetical protein